MMKLTNSDKQQTKTYNLAQQRKRISIMRLHWGYSTKLSYIHKIQLANQEWILGKLVDSSFHNTVCNTEAVWEDLDGNIVNCVDFVKKPVQEMENCNYFMNRGIPHDHLYNPMI